MEPRTPLHPAVKELLDMYSYWDYCCYLCTVNKQTGNSTLWQRDHIDQIARHKPWQCKNYCTPQKARERLKELDRCIACGIDYRAHCDMYEDHNCDLENIEYLNWDQLIYDQDKNLSGLCGKCGSGKHAFWTCDGKPHPGSQFKKSKGDAFSKLLTNEEQNPKALKSATSINLVSVQNEKIIENRQNNDIKAVEPSSTSIKTSEYKICSFMKEEFNSVHSKIVAMHSDLNDKLAVFKSTKEKDESLVITDKKLDKSKEQDNIIKDQKCQIENLKGYLERQENYWSDTTVNLYSEIDKLKKELKEKSVNYNILETLRKNNKILKEKNKQNNIDKSNFMQQYQEESEKFMNLLSIIFPKEKMEGNLDNIPFLETLENKVIISGCESTACQRKIQELTKSQDEEISILKEDFSKLEAQLTVSESNLLNSHSNLRNTQAHFETLKHEINHYNETIYQKDKTIETLQFQLKGLQDEFLKKDNINYQEENKNLSMIDVKMEEKLETKDPDNFQENKFDYGSEIISSNIEKILLEISNEKRLATEQRKNLNDKINTFGTDLTRYMKRKLMKYRGERSSQIASFEERVKREVSNIMSRSSNEEIRLLENKHRHEKQDIIKRIENLEELYQKDHQKMTEKINEIKDANRDLINALAFKNEKERAAKTVLNQRDHNSVTQELYQESIGKEATNNIPLFNTYHNKIHMPAQNDLNNTEYQKVENIKIPHGSNKMQNYDSEFLEEENYKSKWNISHSKKSKSSDISNSSPKLGKVQNVENADLQQIFTQPYKFVIEMEDKILLYDKDPRLRSHLGSNIKLSNKFGCLENNKYHEREI